MLRTATAVASAALTLTVGCASTRSTAASPAAVMPAAAVTSGPSRSVSVRPGPRPVVPAVHCPAVGGVVWGVPAREAPRDRLFPPGATALTVCSWAQVSADPHDPRWQTYRLTRSLQVPAARVVAVVASLDALPREGAFLACMNGRDVLRLSLVAGYRDGRRSTVQLVAPCSVYLTNGSFSTYADPALVAALQRGLPVSPPAVP